jgi:hypothetical protein
MAHRPRDHDLPTWLASFPPQAAIHYAEPLRSGEPPEARQARLFKAAIYDLLLLMYEFGYEAVYFGVGCEVFPDAVASQGDDER